MLNQALRSYGSGRPGSSVGSTNPSIGVGVHEGATASCEAREDGYQRRRARMLRVRNGFTGPHAPGPAVVVSWARARRRRAQERVTAARLERASLGPGPTFGSGGHDRTARGPVDQLRSRLFRGTRRCGRSWSVATGLAGEELLVVRIILLQRPEEDAGDHGFLEFPRHRSTTCSTIWTCGVDWPVEMN